MAPRPDLWRRRWRLFFLATAGLFGHANGDEWGVSHYRFARLDAPRDTCAGDRRLCGDPDPRVASCNPIALLVASNQPFYPLYVYFTVSPHIAPTLLTFLSTPFFVAVPALSRRSPVFGRALLPLTGHRQCGRERESVRRGFRGGDIHSPMHADRRGLFSSI